MSCHDDTCVTCSFPVFKVLSNLSNACMQGYPVHVAVCIYIILFIYIYIYCIVSFEKVWHNAILLLLNSNLFTCCAQFPPDSRCVAVIMASYCVGRLYVNI